MSYEIDGEPAFVAVCHCTHCQKQTGSSFALHIAVPRSALTLVGAIKTFQDRGDSGLLVARNFCPECGSPIFANPECRPNISFVSAGTLDDPSTIKPTVQIFCDSAEPWLHLDGLESYPRMPI